MMTIRLLFISILICNMSTAQTKPCSLPESTQFDFWVGDWELTWNDTMKGSNLITKEMDGCLIHEKFNDRINNFKGESWSMYNPTKKKWEQTWVDNSGAFMVFEGEMKDGQMDLRLEKTDANGKPVIMSMLFHNITANSFDWDWRSSTDNGKTWTSKWLIHYKRKTSFDFTAMRTYFFVQLKPGPKRDQDEATANKIQEGHLNNFYTLTREGKLSMVGPLMDSKEILGICVYNVATKEEVEKLIALDPAIQSGRLVAEIFSWYAMPGSFLQE